MKTIIFFFFLRLKWICIDRSIREMFHWNGNGYWICFRFAFNLLLICVDECYVKCYVKYTYIYIYIVCFVCVFQSVKYSKKICQNRRQSENDHGYSKSNECGNEKKYKTNKTESQQQVSKHRLNVWITNEMDLCCTESFVEWCL